METAGGYNQRMDLGITNQGIEIDRIIRSNRKTITLVIEKDGSLTVRAPNRVPMNFIREFVGKHADWILKHQQKVRNYTPVPEREYTTGEIFPYLGKTYPLEITREQEEKLRFNGRFKMAESARAKGRVVFESWYKTRAKELFPVRVRMLADKHNLQFLKVRISSARTRWGSCSSKGTISLSWRLILLPMEIVDYVVIHELCHTVEHNHSNRFWRQVEKILPEYRLHRAWLRKNGQVGVMV